MDHVSLLLVDDEQAILHMLKTVLLKEQFLDIDTITTAEAALEACNNKTYHCIVLDIMLPGKSGLEICPFLRQVTDAPILFLTAKTTDYDKLTGFAVGGDDYVVKPFNPLEVVARIKSLLNRYLPSQAMAVQQQHPSISSHANASSTALSQGVYDFGRFQVFELAGELRVQGQAVTCPALVFQLLLFFCKHPNRIFTKSELYERVWGSEAISDDNTVMVHIHRIRERIEADPSNPAFLVNVRGLGYKLIPAWQHITDMSIRRKLLTRFIGMLTGTVILIILLGSLAAFLGFAKINEVNIVDDFAVNGLDQLINSAEILPDNTIRYDPDLLKQVDKNQGWLQVLDEKGFVIDDYHAPSDVPNHYKPGELIAYSQADQSFPYQLSMLIREKDGKYFTLLYGERNEAQSLLDEIRPKLSYASGKLTVKPAEQESIRNADAYIQILDPYGKEIDSYNKPAVGVPNQYSIQDLVLQVRYPTRSGISVATWYDTRNETTWMVSVRVDSTVVEKSNPYAFILEPALIVLILSIVALLVVLALWYANRFGAPMLHMLQWLQRLEQGQYEEPSGGSGIPRSQRRNGKWKRKYQVYGDVLHSMQALSHTLKQDEELRKQTDSLREEWIAGITHDLKTPLSSIQGYAHMLETDKYAWTTEEVREFAGIMIDKSMYMDRLVNDLAMTYRLRSGGYQPEVERTDVNTLLRDLLQRAERNPAYGEGRIVFKSADAPVYGLVHVPSFERIVDNLTANALLHNPPDAILVVRAEAGLHDGEFTIEFTDNGRGMSPETVWKLFERYYRGTDTGTSDVGSGLGMAVTRGLIEAMKGRIEVSSTPGEGTTIRLIWMQSTPDID